MKNFYVAKWRYYSGKIHYYVSIMLDASPVVLYSKLCRHSVSTPILGGIHRKLYWTAYRSLRGNVGPEW